MDPTALPGTLRARALTRQADWAPKSEVGLVECGLLNPGPLARPSVRPSASPPDRWTANTLDRPSPPVRPSAGPPDQRIPSAQSARLPDPPSAPRPPRPPSPPVRACCTPSAPPGLLPRLFRPSACPGLVGPVGSSAPLSAPFPPPSARPSAAFPPRPLVRSSARPLRQRLSARPLVRSVHASSTTSARPVRSARARQPPLYIPHPSSPQIIQLFAVRVGPRVSVAPLRTAALRGAQGLREVGVNCGGIPCNFFLRSKQHGEGDHLHPGRPGYSSS